MAGPLRFRTVRLIAVNVGTPVPLTGDRTGKVTLTGIVKHTVLTPVVAVGFTNIAGDRQADLKNHGGPDKAVYCYSHDHLAAWRGEIGYPDERQAPFGENLSLSGTTEDDVHIGDRWQWGGVVLEVAQPRWPCFKLGLHAQRHMLPAELIESERSGWYCRVVVEGEAPTSGTLILLHRDDGAPTVHDAFQAAKGALPRELALQIAQTPTLAQRWRDMILRRNRETGMTI